jgi:PAS domain S-box-containing protein
VHCRAIFPHLSPSSNIWDPRYRSLIAQISESRGASNSHPRLERRLRLRRGGVQSRDTARRGARARSGGDRYIFDKELRRSVIFGRHDLIQDAPISRVSLLVCRNCLMYLNAEAQSRVLERFYFALDDAGFVFLGRRRCCFRAMNEELQSTNEELQAANEELRQRGDELNQVNGFLESILSSMPEGVVVPDNELRVLAWNHRAEDLWGLRSDEVRGKHFLNLDIGLPVREFTQPIRGCLSDSTYQERTVKALNRRGKRLAIHVACSRLHGMGKIGISGVILTMKELAEQAASH